MKRKNKKIIRSLSNSGVDFEIISSLPIIRVNSRNHVDYIVGDSFPFNSFSNVKVTIDKHLTKKILNKAGIKTSKGFLVLSYKEFLEKEKIKFPLVAKPNNESCGECVFTNLSTNKELRMAISSLKKQNHIPFLIEEYFKGDDFRFLVLKGKVIAIAKRIPPFVVGDGKKTLKRLIGVLNKGKDKDKKLKIDEETLRNIKKQKVFLSSVIEKEKIVRLRENANVKTGGLSQDVTDKVHPKFKEIAIRAARELGLNFAGVDILAKDITKGNSSYVLIEVNGLPGWEFHEMVDIGERREIAKEIIKEIHY